MDKDVHISLLISEQEDSNFYRYGSTNTVSITPSKEDSLCYLTTCKSLQVQLAVPTRQTCHQQEAHQGAPSTQEAPTRQNCTAHRDTASLPSNEHTNRPTTMYRSPVSH